MQKPPRRREAALFYFYRRTPMSALVSPLTDLDEFEAAVARASTPTRSCGHNAYTSWFARGEATLDELRDFTVQFSVFSHLFIEAQLRKCINAPDLQSYRAGKEILLNELGVVFAPSGQRRGRDVPLYGRPLRVAGDISPHALGLQWREIGKRRLRARVDAGLLRRAEGVVRVGGRVDRGRRLVRDRALGGGGFWKQLIAGLRAIKIRAATRTCRWGSGRGTTRWKRRMPRTPTTSCAKHSQSRVSRRNASSSRARRSSTPSPVSGTG